MKLHSFRTPLIVALTALSLTLGVNRLHADQPEMNMAIEQLEKAKHEPNHAEHLEKAKFHLEEAARNKHGERVAAIEQIRMALDDVRKGELHRMEEHINAAIHEVREGKALAR
jgi:hypothetical protein